MPDTDATEPTPEAELIVPTEEVLPGEQQADDALLDTAVAEINRLYIAKGMETARVIGEYVINAFFGGELDNFRAKERNHLTFRALAEREDLHVSHTWIWRAVSVLDQLRLLPEDIASALPFTHHTLLLPLKSERRKVSLAKKAVAQGWPKRRLEAEVRKARERETAGSRAGRPPLPRFVKSVRKLDKMLKNPEETFGDTDEIATMDAADAQKLYQTVTGMKLQCEALQRALQTRVPGFAPATPDGDGAGEE